MGKKKKKVIEIKHAISIDPVAPGERRNPQSIPIRNWKMQTQCCSQR